MEIQRLSSTECDFKEITAMRLKHVYIININGGITRSCLWLVAKE
jgi:hypothetical protein